MCGVAGPRVASMGSYRHPVRRIVTMDVEITAEPGCTDRRHNEEVDGACMAWAQGHRWEGPTEMDCGCVLTPHLLAGKRENPAG